MEDYGSYIDLSKVEDEEKIKKAVDKYSIFGRVSPEQKQLLVKALKENGHTVAMTGDGVNDVLALREADCSIAMAEGNDAAKQVSQLVLLDSDFSTLPDVLAEGRRVVNNIQKWHLFSLLKHFIPNTMYFKNVVTITAFLLSLYKITLIDLIIEGYPSFFLSFEPDKKKNKRKIFELLL